jgi:DNA-binding HxlR family transcriptional regulator
MINGLRNRDLQRLLWSTAPLDPKEKRRRSAAVSRKLRLLVAHGLIHKVQKTHRYQVSANGRSAIQAILSIQQTSMAALSRAAA